MNLTKSISILIILSIVLISCNNRDEERQGQVNDAALEEALLKANIEAVRVEDQQIDDFVDRNQWEVQKTGTGLRYLIYETGNGEKAEEGMVAEIEFEIRLISGELVYSSDVNGPKEFLIGKGGVEPGLEEGILLLHEGDRAKFILPSHRAFGLTGDQDKIPPKATLIYDVKLIKIKGY